MVQRVFIAGAACAAGVAALYENDTAGVIAPCDSPIFCQGPLLRDIQLAQPFSDSKTFVDLPTIRPVEEVLAAYQNLSQPITNDTALQSFLTEYFGQPGGEIAATNETLMTNSTFLANVNSSIVADFTRQVIDIWPTLTRDYIGGSMCDGCESSFIPANRTFVVAGGRFREPYYWDSFWILEGLLRSGGSYIQIGENVIQNFLDAVEQYGFVPNGFRKYYLNRSQPPVLTQMVRIYIQETNDTSILERALPLLVKEQEFFAQNNTVLVNSTSGMYNLSRYAVLNNQPRPESYLEDYETANNLTFVSSNGTNYSVPAISNETIATLYANLAAGAESGWDYSSRWLRNPLGAASDDAIPLRSLNTMNIIPVDLNAILYGNEIDISEFYNLIGEESKAQAWAAKAYERSQAMYALQFNETWQGYFDYNLSSNAQHVLLPLVDANSTENTTQPYFSASQFFPFWTGAVPDEIKFNATRVNEIYAPVKRQLGLYPGGIVATDIETSQQWDFNVWAPLQYALIKGALSVPQPDSTAAGPGEVEAWGELQGVAKEIAQRYVASTYCTWRATGGSHPTLDPPIPQVPGSLNGTTGTMFEKYSATAIDAVGGGGEYVVVPGFGWSNGVLIWAVDTFGDVLVTPECGNITANTNAATS